jgi:hypothetical protein
MSPVVKGRHFSYSPAGKKAAEKFAKKTGMSMKKADKPKKK